MINSSGRSKIFFLGGCSTVRWQATNKGSSFSCQMSRQACIKNKIKGNFAEAHTSQIIKRTWIYLTWPLKKQAAYKQAARGTTALSPFWGTRQWRYSVLPRGTTARFDPGTSQLRVHGLIHWATIAPHGGSGICPFCPPPPPPSQIDQWIGWSSFSGISIFPIECTDACLPVVKLIFAKQMK